ncbi:MULTISPECIES: VOC family protein [Stenotrophomonas]|uniref:Glyoxalase n=1 Tax=Stenotrophomonas maltophilia TaxID=40324 RepID=A0A2W6IHJ2_STEMA|nr:MULTISPECIES: VOC family protein [Stenotrophomonas]MBH1411356.1 VOC family protein [Stenotrophomonas maltophilia]PSM14577.1 glyoxalase [Stenotrophomonas maltophilia]PZS93736.1 glyoxalase [Stenotrophomonas maltophilia]HDS1299729.1 VOC family protein [Stenotrophomonas maltophilia]HDS1524367.1 VOC family protein [Stenotrophomonas maltophilia]
MAHQSRLAGFIIDCQDTPADEGARFWAAALGLQAQPSYGEDGAEYAELRDAPGGLQVEVQRVAHPSRVHLDIESDDIDAEADRLEKLGARRIGFVKRWWVMEAPTGHRFCIVRMRERAVPANLWP